MNRLIAATLLLMTTNLSADEQKPTAESPAPQRIPLGTVRPPLGMDGSRRLRCGSPCISPPRGTVRRS